MTYHQVKPFFLVPTNSAGQESPRTLVTLTDGRVFATWQMAVSGSIYEFGRILNPDGTFASAPMVVGGDSFWTTVSSDAAALSNGGFVNAWTEYFHGDVTRNPVIFQFYDSAGAKVGGEIVVRASSPARLTSIGVEVLSGGNVVVSWETPEGGNHSSYARIYNSAGVPVTGEIVLETGAYLQDEVFGLTALKNNTFVLAHKNAGVPHLTFYNANGVVTKDVVLPAADYGNAGPLLLDDGSLAVIARNGIMRRYSETGDALSVVNTGVTHFIRDIAQLSDGRIAVAYIHALGMTNPTLEVAILSPTGAPTGPAHVFGINGHIRLTALANGNLLVGITGDSDQPYPNDFVATILNPRVASGSAGADRLVGGDRADAMRGLDGNDVLIGNGGHDKLIGGNGDDTLVGGLGADVLNGGAGVDTASYAQAATRVGVNLLDATRNFGEARGDTFFSIENIVGSRFNDQLTGNNAANVISGGAGADIIDGGRGNDTLRGDAGNDILIGGGGADRLFGGAGIDTASYATAAAGVHASLVAPTDNRGDARGDTYSSIENLIGSNFNDRLTGNGVNNAIQGGAGNDILNGMRGNDVLSGGAGNDRLMGHLGADTLTGGAGQDTFVFHTPLGAGNVDRIMDFNVADDTIALHKSIFSAIGGSGVLAAGYFTANAAGAATSPSHRIIYETDTGRLFYDADGAGAGAKIQFATLSPGLSLTNADFILFG